LPNVRTQKLNMTSLGHSNIKQTVRKMQIIKSWSENWSENSNIGNISTF